MPLYCNRLVRLLPTFHSAYTEDASSLHDSGGIRMQNISYATVVYTGLQTGALPNKLLQDGGLRHHVLVLVDSGRLLLQGDGDDSLLFADGCNLLRPGERIQICREDAMPRQYRIIAFDVWRCAQTNGGLSDEEPSETDSGAVTAIEPAIFPVSGLLEPHLTDEVRRWMEAYEHTHVLEEPHAFTRSVRFLELLSNIWRSDAERKQGQQLQEAIQQTIRLMEQCYARHITREELARLANMSPSHYSFVFKREIGKSPLELLTEIRLRHAKKQLLFSDRKLRDIAESVGYRNEFYFSRQFKQVIGISPKQFAQLHFAKHIDMSHPFPPHMESLGLASLPMDRWRDSFRIAGLYVEDFLIALGVRPVLKCIGNSFRQAYLNAYLQGVEEWSVLSFDFDAIAAAKPDLIILGHPTYGDDGNFTRFSEIAPTYSIRKGLHQWEHGVRMIGQLLNRLPHAEAIITQHEELLRDARSRLAAVCNETIALVRICNDRRIRLYGGPGGYSGTVLYHDLGLAPSASVLQHAWHKPSGYAPITAEQLYELQTGHLFVVVDPAGQAYWNQLVGNPRWSRLPCVSANRCYEVRFDIWMTFGIIAHRLKLHDVLRCLVPPGRAFANNRI